MSAVEQNVREQLDAYGWPRGLQETFLKSLSKNPIRFFIVDDSGSMASADGRRLVSSAGGKASLVNCTRWAELVDSMKFHASLAHTANSLSEFRMLNSSTPILIGNGNDAAEYSRLLSILDQSPGGGTPLCRHINEVIQQVTTMKDQLRAAGHKAIVVIATDGESSDGNLVQAMKPLEQLPVWVVVKLCTDDDRVVNYWNNVDSQLELEMDVLDDIVGESEEIRAHNPWLTYGLPLHRLREFGITIKEMDLLDESKLSAEQMRACCAAIFGGSPNDYPHPQADPKAFMHEITAVNKKQPGTWSPHKRTIRPWIEINHLQSQYFGGGCSIM